MVHVQLGAFADVVVVGAIGAPDDPGTPFPPYVAISTRHLLYAFSIEKGTNIVLATGIGAADADSWLVVSHELQRRLE